MSTKRSLNEKTFILRNSLLTDLFENQHVKTVYHIFVATFIVFFINTTAHDYINKGELILGLKLIKLAFDKIHIVFLLWICCATFTCLIYFLFKFWAKYRYISSKIKNIQIWDYSWAVILISYYLFCFRLASKLVIKFELPPASAGIVVLEQTRFLMKIHSFIRSNITKVIHFKPHTENTLSLPEFKKFLYFLFAPTLIYQDEYPRTKKINWKKVFLHLMEIIGEIFYLSFVIDRFLIPGIREFGIRPFTIKEVILSIFENTLIGILILLTIFYLLLHSWHNFFAEIMRFGDRMFYKDWWTCTSYPDYFRKWNIIVYSWLYTYIYKDVYEILTNNNRIIARLSVLIISAIVHEWVLTYMFGFFFPALFLEFFIIGSILSFVNPPKLPILNILFWYSLALGMSTLVTLYAFEFYARINAPIDPNSFKDFFIPRLLTNNYIVFK